MPLTALDQTGSVLDSTACSDGEWHMVYKAEAASLLSCRECGADMIAKVSSRHLRFFAHKRRPDDCIAEAESAEHRELKRRVALAIRDVGATAIVEAVPQAGDQGGWRADVLGISPHGKRVAFEVQLAAMTISEGQMRTERYARDLVDTVWISTKNAHWISALPSVHILVEGSSATADRGLARLGSRTLRWEAAGEVPFEKVVRGLLDGRIAPTHAFDFTESAGGRTFRLEDAVLLVSTNDKTRRARADAEEERRRQAEQAEVDRELAQELQRRRNIAALYERQERVLQTAVTDAMNEGHPSHMIWLGVPRTWWNGESPVPLAEALGSEATGRGAVVWAGPSHDVQLWAVVCPVAGQATPGLGKSWRRRGVRVYAETPREASRIASALEWRPAEIHIAAATDSRDPASPNAQS